MQFRRIDHTQIRPPIQRLRSNQIFAQISHCYWGVGGSSLKPRRHSWGKCIFLNRAGVYWIYKRPSLGFALGPRGANCLRARIFQYIPPLGSVLLHFLTSVYVDPRTKNQHNEIWILKKVFLWDTLLGMICDCLHLRIEGMNFIVKIAKYANVQIWSNLPPWQQWQSQVTHRRSVLLIEDLTLGPFTTLI